MKTSLKPVAIILSSCLLLTGCSGISGQTVNKMTEAQETANVPEELKVPATTTESTETALGGEELETQNIEKYNAYIDLNNFMNDRLYTVIDSYFSRVAMQPEFAMQENNTDFWCNSLGESYFAQLDLVEGFAESEPPMPEVEEASKNLLAVMRPMMETFDEIYNYGELKTYKDDDYAGAAELHAKLWPLFEAYQPLEEAYYEAVNTIASAQEAEDLKYFEENGLVAHFTYSSLINKAQEIQGAIYDQNVFDENILELDVEALTPLYDEFVQLVTDSLAITEEQIKEEGGFSTSMLQSAIKDTKVSLTNIFERVKEQRALESYELNSAFPASGTIAEFNEEIGALIDQYNYTWQ